jgi:hypothetical protein
VKFHRKDLYNFHIFSHEEQKFEQAAPVGGLDFTKKEKIQNPKKNIHGLIPPVLPHDSMDVSGLVQCINEKGFFSC